MAPLPPEIGLSFTVEIPAWIVDCADEALLILLLIALVWLLWHPSVPRVVVPLEDDEKEDVLPPAARPSLFGKQTSADLLPCADPATGRSLGTVKAFSEAEVVACVARAHAARACALACAARRCAPYARALSAHEWVSMRGMSRPARVLSLVGVRASDAAVFAAPRR